MLDVLQMVEKGVYIKFKPKDDNNCFSTEVLRKLEKEMPLGYGFYYDKDGWFQASSSITELDSTFYNNRQPELTDIDIVKEFVRSIVNFELDFQVDYIGFGSPNKSNIESSDNIEGVLTADEVDRLLSRL